MKMENNFIHEYAPQISLEEATENDVQALLEIEQSVAGQNTYSPYASIEEILEEMKLSKAYFIRNESGARVGSIFWQKTNEKAYIHGLVVDPRYAGNKYGKAALQKVLSEKCIDVLIVELTVHPRGPGRKIYEELGFGVVETVENMYSDGEMRYVMQKKMDV